MRSYLELSICFDLCPPLQWPVKLWSEPPRFRQFIHALFRHWGSKVSPCLHNSLEKDIIFAASASPSAWTIFCCRSWYAFSTKNAARWASCCATYKIFIRSVQLQKHKTEKLNNLFGFNSCSIFFTETKLRDWHIIKNDVEIPSSFCEFTTDEKWNLLTLCNKLRRIEFCNYTFQNFIANGRKNFFIII